jgi:hypothetical protein
MSRSGYCDDFEQWSLICWRGQVASAIRGKRGQQLLVDLYKALAEMPEKKLISGKLVRADGEVCALGALGQARKMDIKPEEATEDDWDNDDDWEGLGTMFGVADQLTREIMYMNDEFYYSETPEERYEKMKSWVLRQILPVPIEIAATP